MRVRALLADDEPLARRRIRGLLAQDGEVDIVGECGDGLSAAQAIEQLSPDLLFLDVQMPGLDGLSALERVRPERRPRAMLFVSAYEEHAVRAFEVHAVDYLLKPFTPERFREAVARAKERIRGGPDARLLRLLGSLAQQRDRVAVKDRGRVVLVPVAEIDWVGAAGNYAEVHAGASVHLLRATLAQLETRLPGFLRVHRATLVNAERVRELRPLLGGDHRIVLLDGTLLTLSRTYRDTLRRLLGGMV
ncbi:MAG: LytR/AlgR family response regulator transcription factor [Myxococcales bacterium]